MQLGKVSACLGTTLSTLAHWIKMLENVDRLKYFRVKQRDRNSMMTNPKSAFTWSRLRSVLCSLFFVVAGIAILGEVASWRALAQRADASASPEDDSWDEMDISAAAVPTPPPCNGQLITILDETFDDVTPPDLPPFWTAINGIDPDGILWQTSDSGLPSPPYDTAPNAAWVNDPPVISDKYLDAPGVSATESWYVRLTFRHNVNLEASEVDPNLGFDGGVLELSIDGGNTFQDITVWGSFERGGYNRTIATDRGSPIAGRPAWSGNSRGFITTVVNLPPELLNAVLRWRMASDNAGSSEGWRVDTTNIVWCHFSGTPTPTPPPTPTPGPITLSAAGRKVGGINTVRLTWSGATSNQVDVYRNDVLIVTTANNGSYFDSTGDTGRARYSYRVCEFATSTCSNDARVRFPAAGE